MKIHKLGKKVAAPHPELVEVIKKLVELPQDELPVFLATIPSWLWPRSDLHSWVQVLNKFDDILKGFIEQYELEKLQVNPFTPLTKAIITEILRFETLLLDNSTNRKLFASYDRINSLLFSTDTEVVIGALQLLLRPSQQYSSQPSASHTLHVSTKRLIALANRWAGVREHGLGFVDLFTMSKTVQIPPEAAQVTHTFYKKGTSVSATEKVDVAPSQTPVKSKAAGSSIPVTPSPAFGSVPSPTVSGMVTINIPSLIDSEKRAVDILADEIEANSIPDEEKFELLCRIRCALALGSGPVKLKERENLAIIRLLAIAIFAHTISENEAQTALFIYEPDLILHLAEFIHPDRAVSMGIQTAAIAALDGLARYRGKTGEVLSAVNAGVTHGILMSLLRRTVISLAEPNSEVTSDLPESLIGFIGSLSANPAGGSMIVGAGLVPLLIQLLQNRVATRLQIISKVTNLIDVTLYGYGNAFQSFCNLRGVEVLLTRVEDEVNIDIEESTMDDPSVSTAYGRLPFPRSLLLKHILRSMHRMMQASGTSESLRGLIDSSLPQSIKKIIHHRGLFGPAIFSIAINIMAAFVHNEPTSLTIIQEAGLPEAFYGAIDTGLEAAHEVITALPGAIGALCLNQAGLDQLAQRPTIIPRIFSILTSDRHVKTLQEKDNATYIGASIDELIRHHPSIKTPAFDAIKSTLQRIEDLGNEFVIPKAEMGSYGLRAMAPNGQELELTLEEPAITISQPELTTSGQTTPGTGLPQAEDGESASSEEGNNLIVTYIDNMGRFLEGLFQHTAHCREFVTKTGGVERLCRLYALPCLPANFSELPAAHSLIAVIRTMAEAVPALTLERLSKLVKESLDETRPIWQPPEGASPNIVSLMEVKGADDAPEANRRFRQLVTLHLHVHLLAQVYSTAGYTHGRSTSTILQIISSTDGADLIADLGVLYRTFLWEAIILKGPDPFKKISGVGSNVTLANQTPVNERDEHAVQDILLEGSLSLTTAPGTVESGSLIKEQNTKAVRAIVQNLSKVTTPFFQAVVKLFLYNRRSPDITQKNQARSTAKLVTQVLLRHLRWRGSDDKIASFTYSTLIIGLIAVLLFDERTTQNTLHTLLLVTLRQIGALDAILEICDSYATTLASPVLSETSSKTAPETSEITAASTGLGVGLHLFHALVSSRPLLESGQTTMLITRDKPKTDPDYFEPHDFLVRIRASIFPLLSKYWNAPWLDTAQPDIVKLVVQGFLEIMGADNEEPSASSSSLADVMAFSGGIPGGPGRRIPAPGPDENRIRQLCDMGFPRASAERALARTHNNLSAATEYLLSHPFPSLGPPPAPEADPEPEFLEEDDDPAAIDEGSGNNAVEDEAAESLVLGSDVEMVDGVHNAGSSGNRPNSEPKEPETPIPGDDKDYKAELKMGREAAADNIANRALTIVDLRPELVFEIKRAFVGPDDKYQAQAARGLFTDAKLFDISGSNNDAILAGRLRLLALVSNEMRPSDSQVIQDNASTLVDLFIHRLLTISNIVTDPSPPWLAPLLLALENLLVLGEETKNVPIPTPEEEVPVVEFPFVAPHTAARSAIFNFALQFLAKRDADRNDLIAVLRLLVLITRDHSLATDFVSRGGISLLLDRFKAPGADNRGCQVHVIIILRHVIEDRAVLETIMKQDITRWFSQPRSRISDVQNFLRHNSHVALRDPSVFIDTIKILCTFTTPNPANSLYHLILKDASKPASIDPPTGFELPVVPLTSEPPPGETTMDDIPPPQGVESLDVMLKYLIGELTRTGKAAVTASQTADTPGTSHGDGAKASQVSTASSPENSNDGTTDYVYACFILQCLTEILSAYNSCKLAFLTYARKRTGTPAKDASRHRGTLLHFLLSEMVSSGEISAQAPTPNAKRRVILSNWAMSVVVSLCVDSSVASNLKDIPPEIVTVRKLVLDAIAKAFKDAPAGESLDARYSRLSSLADLAFRLLSFRPSTSGSNKSQGDANLHIPKLMLEKNFVALFTTTLGEIDLNYPNVKSLVTTILRPLEHLTKIAIKMGRATEKTKTSTVPADDSASSGFSVEDDEQGPSDREETPDLYRTSALGMYGGEMEDMAYPAREADMDEDEDDEDDVEMEYADEDIGSDHTSETSQDEDDDAQDDIDVVSEGSEDPGWQDDDGSEDEDSDPEDPRNAEIEPDEILWEDEGEEGIGDDPLGDAMDQLEDEVEMAHAHADDEDDEDDGAGEDEAQDLGTLDIQLGDPSGAEFSDSWQFEPRDTARTGFELFTRAPAARRGRLVDMEQYLQLLGRPRQAGAAAPDPSTHPLMAEAPNRPATSNTTTHHHPRVSHRRVLRSSGLLGGDSEGGSNGLLTMIQDLIGEDGYHMVEQMMARGGGTADAIVEVRADGGPSISIAHLRAAHRSSPPTAAQSLDGPQQDAARQVQEFSPVATQQRWIDEGKMTQGKNVADRLSTLANRIILTLLPDARTREAARLEKEKEQREKEEKEEKEEKLLRDAQLQTEKETRKQAEETSSALPPPDPDPSRLNSDSNATPEQSSSAMDVEPSSAIGPSAPVVVPVSTAVGAADVEMTDAVESPEIETNATPAGPLLEAAPAPTSDEPITDRSEDVAPATGASPEEESRGAGPSAPAARITVIVNGAPVDITDTGIDPTFLEALPDDMREEVLNQHLRERRAAQPVIRPAESQISPDFLEALPPEIRAEILQQEQEALERARRERERAEAPNGAAPAGPSDIDSASFLASLDPQLRQAVLMEQEDGFLQTLPSALLAEATALFGGPRAGNPRTAPSNPASAPVARKAQVQRDSIQLLDKAGVAILVRLLFFPQVLRKNALHKVLMNLCENSKTRTDLFNLLLGILQDGTGDVATVDKSFSQLSFRSTKSQAGSSSKTPSKSKPGDALLAPSTLATGSTDSIPHLVTHRCLEALTFIVTTNDSAAYYFLTEQESLPALKRSVSRKGKGKEKQTTQTQFPVVLLLGLLDREGLLRSPPMMGAVALLLASVTRPLSTLKDAPSEGLAAPAVSERGGSEPTVPISENPPHDSPAPGGPPDSVPSISSKGIDLAQKLRSSPPQIPASSLRLIANILTTGECSGRTFQLTLSLIQHLLYLPNTREIIAEELKTRAEQLGLSLRRDLDELTQSLEATPSGSTVQSSVVSKFSPASSDQAKLLRVLKTLDFMYTPRPSSSSQSATPSDAAPLAQPSESEAEQVYKIYESFQFTPLWKRLGDSLSVVESKPELDHIATVLLPLIESLMVVCKHVGSKSGLSAAILAGSASPRSATSGREAAEDLFVNFTDAHRKVLNVMVRNNPSLMSGSFSLLVNNPKVLDFDNKRNYFGQQLRRRPHSREHHTTLQLNVRRPHVFEDSYQYLHRKTGDQIKYGKLNVRFYDEEGVDAGGVTREWFQILARRMFNPDYALFQPCAGDKLTYQPNRASSVNPEHLLFFKFVGRVIGKAIYDGRLLDAYFARSLYRQILGKPVDYRDVEWVDPEYYNSLCWILENDPSVLDMNFTVEADEFGLRKVVELKEGGATIPVTPDNKREFVQLSAQYRLYSSIKDQINALLGGFYEIIPKELISIFNEQEVELLISGTPDIDIDEWRAATDYHGYTQTDPVIAWWWRALKSFNRDERAKVLSFATGTSRVPLGGFVELQGVQGVQRFSIHRAYGEADRLPQAHTCFNQIDLPQYSSYEKLRMQLLLAINEGGEGFGFA